MTKDIESTDDMHVHHNDETGSDAGAMGASGSLLPSTRSAKKPATRKLVTTLNLSSRTCKWPFGDPAKPGFHYCGHPPQTGRPYCDEHDSMSYQAAPRKRSS